MPTGKIDIRTCRISLPGFSIIEPAIIGPEPRIPTLPAFMTVTTARLNLGSTYVATLCSSVSSKEMAVASSGFASIATR
jgi:hypothetical protein